MSLESKLMPIILYLETSSRRNQTGCGLTEGKNRKHQFQVCSYSSASIHSSVHSLFVMVGAVFVFFCLHAQLWNFFGFVAPLSLKTPLKEYSSARARQVRRTVEFSSKLHRISRSRKQRDRCWPRIRHYCAQSETSIRKSRGSCSLRLKSQGLSRPFWKTFRRRFFRPD